MPAVQHQLSLPLYLWELAEPLDFFAQGLPGHVRAGIDVRWHPTRQLQYTAARWLLYQHLPDPAQPLHTDERGIPSLPGSSLHLSFSHSPGYVGVLLSPDGPVGLDLEQPSLPRNWETARIFMNAYELARFRQAPDPTHFLSVWCAKEALYKVLNRRWEALSFKRELWTDGPMPTTFPCQLRGGMQRPPHIHHTFALHLDRPVPDLLLAAWVAPPAVLE